MTSVIASWLTSHDRRELAAYTTDWTYQAALATLWTEFVQDARHTFVFAKLS